MPQKYAMKRSHQSEQAFDQLFSILSSKQNVNLAQAAEAQKCYTYLLKNEPDKIGLLTKVYAQSKKLSVCSLTKNKDIVNKLIFKLNDLSHELLNQIDIKSLAKPLTSSIHSSEYSLDDDETDLDFLYFSNIKEATILLSKLTKIQTKKTLAFSFGNLWQYFPSNKKELSSIYIAGNTSNKKYTISDPNGIDESQVLFGLNNPANNFSTTDRKNPAGGNTNYSFTTFGAQQMNQQYSNQKQQNSNLSGYNNSDLIDNEAEMSMNRYGLSENATLRMKGRILLSLMNKQIPNIIKAFLRWRVRSNRQILYNVLVNFIIKSKINKNIALWRFKWISDPLINKQLNMARILEQQHKLESLFTKKGVQERSRASFFSIKSKSDLVKNSLYQKSLNNLSDLQNQKLLTNYFRLNEDMDNYFKNTLEKFLVFIINNLKKKVQICYEKLSVNSQFELLQWSHFSNGHIQGEKVQIRLKLLRKIVHKAFSVKFDCFYRLVDFYINDQRDEDYVENSLKILKYLQEKLCFRLIYKIDLIKQIAYEKLCRINKESRQARLSKFKFICQTISTKETCIKYQVYNKLKQRKQIGDGVKIAHVDYLIRNFLGKIVKNNVYKMEMAYNKLLKWHKKKQFVIHEKLRFIIRCQYHKDFNNRTIAYFVLKQRRNLLIGVDIGRDLCALNHIFPKKTKKSILLMIINQNSKLTGKAFSKQRQWNFGLKLNCLNKLWITKNLVDRITVLNKFQNYKQKLFLFTKLWMYEFEQKIYKRSNSLTNALNISSKFIILYILKSCFQVLKTNQPINPWLPKTIKILTQYSPIEYQIAFWRLKNLKFIKRVGQNTHNILKIKKSVEIINQLFQMEKARVFWKFDRCRDSSTIGTSSFQFQVITPCNRSVEKIDEKSRSKDSKELPNKILKKNAKFINISKDKFHFGTKSKTSNRSPGGYVRQSPNTSPGGYVRQSPNTSPSGYVRQSHTLGTQNTSRNRSGTAENNTSRSGGRGAYTTEKGANNTTAYSNNKNVSPLNKSSATNLNRSNVSGLSKKVKSNKYLTYLENINR